MLDALVIGKAVVSNYDGGLTILVLYFANSSVFLITFINPILLGGDNFVLHKKFIQITFNLGKVTQKCYQKCARNLFS